MKFACNFDTHVWSVETKTQHLTPPLDLVPGRRCACGNVVIIDPAPGNIPDDVFQVAHLDTIAAQTWAAANPALKTW